HNIYSGFNNAGSELGHMVIVAGGKLCTCNRKGCWEAYASARGLAELTREAAAKAPDSLLYTMVNGDLSKISAKTPFDAAKQGDTVADMVIYKYLVYVAVGISIIDNKLQCTMIENVSRE